MAAPSSWLSTRNKKHFVGVSAPLGYVAGVGRGAAGFTSSTILAKGNYDQFSGPSGSLFSSADCHKDDEEADSIYRDSIPKIQQEFAHLKPELVNVTEEEWEKIPEVTKRTKEALTNSIVPGVFRSEGVNFREIGLARRALMSAKLNQASNFVKGQSIVDPKGYLTALQNIISHSRDINNVKNVRLILKSARKTNKHHPNVWIAAAQLEEVAGKKEAAQQIIMEGCEVNPTSENLWLEAARIQAPVRAKTLMVQAICEIPTSVRIWIKAADLETETKAKRRIYRKALEYIPNSVRLWKLAVELEEPEEARILLSRAVECCPTSVDLWLALARLETYVNARNVLTRALENNPTHRRIWITAAKLEEAKGDKLAIEEMIECAISYLSDDGVEIDRAEWIDEAKAAEKAGAVHTCQLIIKKIIGHGVDQDARKKTWIDDAESCAEQGALECTRAIYSYALDQFPSDESIWARAAAFENLYGTRESLESLLQNAFTLCPRCESLWLMGATSKLLANDVPAARGILSLAFEANPNSQKILVAAVELEFKDAKYERARELLAHAKTLTSESMVLMQSAKLEWALGNLDGAINLLEKGLKITDNLENFWMMKGQIEEQQGHLEKALATYNQGIRYCPKAIPLWRLLTELVYKSSPVTKARSVLEKAKVVNPKNEELWLEAIRFEMKPGGVREMSHKLMANALQECPTSGLLWAEAVFMESGPQRKSKSVDALKKCGHNPHVLLAVSKLFWSEHKITKCRDSFNKTVKIDPDLGDSWAYFYKFEQLNGTEEQQDEVKKRCIAAEPHHGEYWCKTSNDIKNWCSSIDKILVMVAEEVPIPI